MFCRNDDLLSQIKTSILANFLFCLIGDRYYALSLRANDFRKPYSREVHGLEELHRSPSGTLVGVELHRRHILINIRHKLDDEINNLALVHRLGLVVRDEEANVITLDGLLPQYLKPLCTLGEEANILARNELGKGVAFLKANADSHAVYACLDKCSLLVAAGNEEAIQDELGARHGLNFRLVVTLDNLRREVGDTNSSV